MEDQILIAEFAGGIVERWYPVSTMYPNQTGLHVVYPVGSIRPPGIYTDHCVEMLKYDKSFDWIIPVAVKCHTVQKEMERKTSNETPQERYNPKDLDDPTGWRAWSCRYVHISTDIQNINKRVIEFIKFYNEHKELL